MRTDNIAIAIKINAIRTVQEMHNTFLGLVIPIRKCPAKNGAAAAAAAGVGCPVPDSRQPS